MCVHRIFICFWNINFYDATSLFWSPGLLFPVSRWRSSQFGRRTSRTSRTWFTSAGRLRSCHLSATRTSFLSMKVRVSRKPGNSHTEKSMQIKTRTPLCFIRTHVHKNTNICDFTPLSAHSALVAKLQDCHVMAGRCHNKTWTEAPGCYSSSVLRLAASASKSLDSFAGVHLDLFQQQKKKRRREKKKSACVHVCDEGLCVWV